MANVRDAALAAIHARLSAEFIDPVDRGRRAPVDLAHEQLPRLVLSGGNVEANTTMEPGYTHYTIEFEVAAYVTGTSDADLEVQQSNYFADIVAALGGGWQPATTGLGEVTELGAEFNTIPAAESKARVAEVVCRFTILAITPAGAPYL